jgi:apolipoprotein N-acyltransferase
MPHVQADAAAQKPSLGEWFRSRTWPAAMLSALLCFLALPPVGAWPLVFLGPVGWLWLARRETLPGKRPYRALWLSGFAFWLGTIHWLRLPHPATSIGWVALSFYLAFYTPALVWLTRVAVHRHRVPLMVAAPLVWMGLELLRGRLLTGFTMGSLGHAPYRWLEFLQIADFAGAYAVSAAVMFFATALARMLPCDGERAAWKPLVPAAAGMALILGYGYFRVKQDERRPGPKVALIQGSIDTTLKSDPAKQQEVAQHYFDLSTEAVTKHRDLDLLVWPETMYRGQYVLRVPGSPPPSYLTEEKYADQLFTNHANLSRHAILLDVPLLLGIDAWELNGDEAKHFNSALFVARDGTIGERYDKMHPVLFGEYVPFGERFPWLYQLTPLGGGLNSGTVGKGGEVAGAIVSPSICYETVMPHVIRRQVLDLRAAGKEPDLLVNVTNDGWFWGSSELDLHLMCGVFRAIECRKPLVIAANTGFSASIDSNGCILQQGPRRAAEVLVAETELDDRRSLYLLWGDFPAGIALLGCCALAVSGWRSRRRDV